MKRHRCLVLLIVGIFAGLYCCGCASSPVDVWAQQRQTLTTFETTMAPAVRSGKLTPTEIDVADAGVKAMRAALADAETHLPAGNGGFKADIDIAKAVAKRLADEFLAPTAPATQPSK